MVVVFHEAGMLPIEADLPDHGEAIENHPIRIEEQIWSRTGFRRRLWAR